MTILDNLHGEPHSGGFVSEPSVPSFPAVRGSPGPAARDTTAKEDELATLRRLRRMMLEVAAANKEGHLASSFSVAEILWTLYDRVMHRPTYLINDPGRDRLIVSKGHCALGLYAILAEKGYISQEELATFCQPGSRLQGHPSRDVPGVECSTGSLGHGLPIAVGMARALKIQGNPARVFCLVGDTECEEGTIWESAALAARFGLDNLVVLVDNNHTSPNHIDGQRHVSDIGSKFRAFGWDAWLIPGHDCEAIVHACQGSDEDGRPRVIVAETVKGYGCKPLSDDPQAWHRRSPRPEELENLIASLG